MKSSHTYLGSYSPSECPLFVKETLQELPKDLKLLTTETVYLKACKILKHRSEAQGWGYLLT